MWQGSGCSEKRGHSECYAAVQKPIEKPCHTDSARTVQLGVACAKEDTAGTDKAKFLYRRKASCTARPHCFMRVGLLLRLSLHRRSRKGICDNIEEQRPIESPRGM